MAVVLWSALSPAAPKIQVCIPLVFKYFYLLDEKTKINKKEAEVGPFKKKLSPTVNMILITQKLRSYCLDFHKTIEGRDNANVLTSNDREGTRISGR